ncbi:phosphatidic acid phosphatase type 2/haloperoxidase [Lipomyces arxii]|uniref:phosphatidic acid phosphatase type 2/haloperoxidase n=1 Tax=Lipomyces arxii TaxID=56418 RepID=UPI0034CF57F0
MPSKLRIWLSYVFDYAVIAILLGVWAYLSTLPPNFSRFSLDNKSLQYPIANPETISYKTALMLCVVVPIGVIFIWALVIDMVRYKSSTFKARLWEFNVGFLGLALSFTLSIVITTSLKGIVGRPRPDSIARCLPRPGSQDADVFGLSSVAICTQTDIDVLNDGWRSWPSGHSSSAFAGLFYLSLYLAGKLSLMDNKGEVWKTAIVMFPTLGAGAIATSRILDHRHHGTDVFTGSILGVATAWLAYRQYYPSLVDTGRQGRAWGIRVWGETKAATHDYVPGAAADSNREDLELGGMQDQFKPESSTANERCDETDVADRALIAPMYTPTRETELESIINDADSKQRVAL